VPRRLHPVRDLGEASAEAVEVDKRTQECRHLHVRLVAQDRDEGFKRRDVRVRLPVDLALDGRRWRGWRKATVARSTVALDHVDGALGDVGCEEEPKVSVGGRARMATSGERRDRRTDHRGRDWLPDEVQQTKVVHELGEERRGVPPSVGTGRRLHRLNGRSGGSTDVNGGGREGR